MGENSGIDNSQGRQRSLAFAWIAKPGKKCMRAVPKIQSCMHNMRID
jgi:hypothetical protein